VDVQPIGFVSGTRQEALDDGWGGAQACITLTADCPPQALEGLAEFSHVEVLFVFLEVDRAGVTRGARHPRDNPLFPRVGIFAQRGRNRPNRLGSTICRLLRIEWPRLYVAELDAIADTPVLDLKPVMREFLPREPVRQPAWSHELMRAYWEARRQ
jgi:tRNA (adenine37-N6)-methyltransferase